MRLFRPSAVIALMATALMPLLSLPTAQAAEPPASRNPTSVAGHAFGLKTHRGPRIAAGHRVTTLGFAAADVLPTSVDLTANTVTPGDQGNYSSCVAWSEGYTLAGYYANAQKRPGAPFAPMYLYSQTHVSSSADGGGAYTSAAWNVLSTQGIAEKSVYTQGDYDFVTMPTSAERANAATHKMNPASYLFSGPNQSTAGIAALKGALASGNPVEIGISVFNPFFYLNSTKSVMTLAMATGGDLGGHAVVAVGYNPTGLVIENSWGTYWGAAGYATLGWDFVAKYVSEASVTSGFTAVPAAPVVTGLSVASAGASGGGSLTLSGTAFDAVDASSISAVTLVNTATPSISVNAPVTARTATTLTVSIPPAPLVDGKPVTGAYRVQVTSPTGVSTDNGTNDDFSYLSSAVTFTVTGPATIAAGSGGPVTLTGTGFGTSAAASSALKLAATVAGQPVALTWISDTSVTIAVPAGIPGQTIPIVLSRSGALSATNTTLKYAAHLTSTTLRSDGTGVRYATVTGTGLAGATGWTLTSPDGRSSTALPIVGPGTASTLISAPTGVLITSNDVVQIKLPRSPSGGAGLFALSFTPNPTSYPGATFLATPGATVPYLAPTLTSLSVTTAPLRGGTVLTATGTNLEQVDRNNPAAVRLINSTNSAVSVNVPVTAQSGTSLGLTIPAAPTLAGTVITGNYRLLVTTAQGTASRDFAYLPAFTISVPTGLSLLASGSQSLTVRSTGFGTTPAEFAPQAVTATVAGQSVAVTWVNDTTVTLYAGNPGKPGSTGDVVLTRRGVASNALTLSYAANISRTSVSTGPRDGGTLVTLAGVGFSGSSVWTVRGTDGTSLTTLPRVSSAQALNALPAGIFVSGDNTALVKMPPASGDAAALVKLPSAFAGLPTVVLLTFTPDQSLYPAAASVPTSKSVFTYTDHG